MALLGIVLALLAFHAKSEDTITVNPGDDVQAMVDKLHSGEGGRIIFNSGKYVFNSSLIVYSNIALQGNHDSSNTDILLTVDSNNLQFNEPLIWNNDQNTSNLTIENLSVLCNIQPSEQNYPPCCHTNDCDNPDQCDNMRTNFVGISMGGGGDTIDNAQNYNYTLRNIQVSHCAMGITMSGWRTVHISNVELFSNGMIQAYFHNIYLRRNFNVTITHMTSYDSPTGNGINMSQSSFLTVGLSAFYNNYWRGLRIYGEDGYVWQGINVYNNSCRNNLNYGFMFYNGYDGIVEYNFAQNNSLGDLAKGGLSNVTFIGNEFI